MGIEDFNQEFQAHLGQLRSYLVRITASKTDAEDITHDTYIRALDKLSSFRGESSLKTWLFTIASNIAKDNMRAKQRWPENVTDIARASAMHDEDFFKEAMEIRATSPQGQFEAKEHIAFCFTCISKSLPLEQQLCIFLKDVYEFRTDEIAGILETTEAMVKYYLHTGRAKMMNIFDGRCALINKQRVCDQCSELNNVFNPKQNAQHELMKIAMVREAEKGDKERLFNLRMLVLRELDPIESGAAGLQLHHLAYNQRVMEKYLAKTPV